MRQISATLTPRRRGSSSHNIFRAALLLWTCWAQSSGEHASERRTARDVNAQAQAIDVRQRLFECVERGKCDHATMEPTRVVCDDCSRPCSVERRQFLKDGRGDVRGHYAAQVDAIAVSVVPATLANSGRTLTVVFHDLQQAADRLIDVAGHQAYAKFVWLRKANFVHECAAAMGETFAATLAAPKTVRCLPEVQLAHAASVRSPNGNVMPCIHLALPCIAQIGSLLQRRLPRKCNLFGADSCDGWPLLGGLCQVVNCSNCEKGRASGKHSDSTSCGNRLPSALFSHSLSLPLRGSVQQCMKYSEWCNASPTALRLCVAKLASWLRASCRMLLARIQFGVHVHASSGSFCGVEASDKADVFVTVNGHEDDSLKLDWPRALAVPGSIPTHICTASAQECTSWLHKTIGGTLGRANGRRTTNMWARTAHSRCSTWLMPLLRIYMPDSWQPLV